MFWTERAIKTLSKAFAGGSGDAGGNSGLGVVGAASRAGGTSTNPYTKGTLEWQLWNESAGNNNTNTSGSSATDSNDRYHTTDYGTFRAMPKLGPVMPRMQVGGLNLAEWNKRFGR